jgi:transcriptional regulator with XRE-family HTH domain
MAHQTSYDVDMIMEALRTARESKRLTQRELSALAGVPQAHISKIERGGVDLRLSSLIEIARVLDLEVVLVPRKLIPVIEAIARSKKKLGTPPADTRALRGIREILPAILERYPAEAKAAGSLGRVVDELGRLPLTPKDEAEIHEAYLALRRMEGKAESGKGLRNIASALQNLRNRRVHNLTADEEGPRPAYTLDDEDDDA